MRTTLSGFQRSMRKACAVADSGEEIIITGRNSTYRFERIHHPYTQNPFEGLEGVFGAVSLPRHKQKTKSSTKSIAPGRKGTRKQ